MPNCKESKGKRLGIMKALKALLGDSGYNDEVIPESDPNDMYVQRFYHTLARVQGTHVEPNKKALEVSVQPIQINKTQTGALKGNVRTAKAEHRGDVHSGRE